MLAVLQQPPLLLHRLAGSLWQLWVSALNSCLHTGFARMQLTVTLFSRLASLTRSSTSSSTALARFRRACVCQMRSSHRSRRSPVGSRAAALVRNPRGCLLQPLQHRFTMLLLSLFRHPRLLALGGHLRVLV